MSDLHAKTATVIQQHFGTTKARAARLTQLGTDLYYGTNRQTDAARKKLRKLLATVLKTTDPDQIEGGYQFVRTKAYELEKQKLDEAAAERRARDVEMGRADPSRRYW